MENCVRLLGVPRRDHAGGTHEPPPGQATHLATILALRGGWVAREDLVALLWPDTDERRGRHNLAQLIYALRRSGWSPELEAEPQRVRWVVLTDVAAFRAAAASGEWAAAIAQYGGDLLEGVPEPTSAPLAEWLTNEKEDLRETWRLSLLRRAEELALACEWRDSARLLRRLLSSDGLLEEAVYCLIRAEALAGRRDAALRVFEDFRSRLLDELGLEPLETTTELVAAVREGLAAPRAEPPLPAFASDTSVAGPSAAVEEAVADVRPGPVRGLGDDSSPFVGRALELAELHGLMRSGMHRLVTVHGAGGTGKTRLVRQLSRERAGHFEDGAAWVPLATATNARDAVEAIAKTLGLQIETEAEPLATALADRELLLILDQVEHLPTLAELVQTLLDATSGIRLLVTSRSPVELPEEAVVQLRGMAVPPRDDTDDAEAYDAIGLLLRAARRTRPNLQPRGSERTALVALARLLDGSPLALELAAGWLRHLEPSELLDEVRRDLDVLRSRERDPERGQASLSAVFESSWALLADAERESLRRLGVFRGGYTRESALAVADVSLATLLALTNRSLLRREGKTRFAMHSVVQHFAELKLAESAAAADLEVRHAAYFLALAEDCDRRLETPEQPTAMARLAEEGPDLTAALERGLARGRTEQAYELVAALGRFWLWRGRNHDGLAWTERLKLDTGRDPITKTAIQVRLSEGLMLEKIGRYDDADLAFQRALDDAERLQDADLINAARRNQSIVAWRRGDLAEARNLLENVCAGYRRLGRETDLAGSLGNLGNVARDAGDLDAAHAAYDQALAIVERLGHVWEIANTCNNKAITYSYAGDREAAVREYQRALELQRSLGNKAGMSMTLTNLGVEHMDNGDLDLAESFYREALALCEETGDADGKGHLNINLGILAQWSGDFDAAHGYLAKALKIRHRLGAKSLVAQTVISFFDLAVARESFERALVLGAAGRKLLAEAGVPLPAPHQAVHDEAHAKVRARVPPQRVAELERRGEALPAADAIEFALGARALP